MPPVLGSHPADLTPAELAALLAQVYEEADQGNANDAPNLEVRTALTGSLGCPEEARASAWEAWAAEPNPADWDAAEYWLDVEFVES